MAADPGAVLRIDGDAGRHREVVERFPAAGPRRGRPGPVRAGRDGATGREDGHSERHGGSWLSKTPGPGPFRYRTDMKADLPAGHHSTVVVLTAQT